MNHEVIEKRKPICCPKCQTEMVCMNKYNLDGNIVSLWYICPRRQGESGCGYKFIVRFDESFYK